MEERSFQTIKLGNTRLSVHQGVLVKVLGNFYPWYNPQNRTLEPSCPITISNADLLYIDELQMIWGITKETELVIRDPNGLPAHGLVLNATA